MGMLLAARAAYSRCGLNCAAHALHFLNDLPQNAWSLFLPHMIAGSSQNQRARITEQEEAHTIR
jgi:hypothetical protein